MDDAGDPHELVNMICGSFLKFIDPSSSTCILNLSSPMAESTVPYTHQLYLGPSDTPGIVLIPVKLTGSKNYGLWSKTMKITLLGKRKLGLVTGTYTKESCKTELHEQWETCNTIVLSWLMNTVSTELLSGIVYASNAHLVWEDLRERFDKVNRMRIFQIHRAIAALSQGTDSVSAYFTKLKVCGMSMTPWYVPLIQRIMLSIFSNKGSYNFLVA